jgi:5-oxoprolinase (ATP-hydrolysing)
MDGRVNEDAIAALMSAGPHPVRGIPERLADLRAQAAANATGARLLTELCAEMGADPGADPGAERSAEAVERGMRDVISDAADATRELLASLPPGTHRFEDSMDEGAVIACAITIGSGRATFDFTGTSGQVATSLNAPRAVVRACVLYALRCLLGRDVPLNDGVLDPVDIVIPPGTILSPAAGAAVCGGNVETSMRVADVILAALGAQAASQGTMNNLTLGDATFAHYETIGGGAGAGPSFDGASAVHSHLTNTRLTDAEILEMRAPVRVLETSVRRGSGGSGRHRGGDGMIRRIQALARLEGALLTERRSRAPFGLDGGSPGRPGSNEMVRRGVHEKLGGKATFAMDAGDIIVIETPGGGGWGKNE